MVKLGCLGVARITPKAILDPAQGRDDIEIVAVAAREPSRARELQRTRSPGDPAAQRWSTSTYEELLADPRVDAVYIATPAALHHRWTMAALKAGKHVLCEKPLASNAAEASEMTTFATDQGLILMEAFHWRYHPFAQAMRDAVTELGGARHATAHFTVPYIAPSDIRFRYELGGGALMDLGCYTIEWCRYVCENEPARTAPTVTSASAVGAEDPRVDAAMTAELRFDNGATATLIASMLPDCEYGNGITIECRSGTVIAVNPLAPQRGNALTVSSGDITTTTEINAELGTYDYQLDAFLHAIETGTPPPTSGLSSVINMTIIDECYRLSAMTPRGM
jgi:predicted dehydrogenase